jgi:hypothetical protein
VTRIAERGDEGRQRIAALAKLAPIDLQPLTRYGLETRHRIIRGGRPQSGDIVRVRRTSPHCTFRIVCNQLRTILILGDQDHGIVDADTVALSEYKCRRVIGVGASVGARLVANTW